LNESPAHGGTVGPFDDVLPLGLEALSKSGLT